MEPWAKVSGAHIVRFGELTKREIQILCTLFLHRNGKSNRCDPSRRALCTSADLEPPHVSLAIAGLESKGWIIERPDKSFHLFEPDEIPSPEPVEKPVSKSRKSVEKSEKITNSVTNQVTNSVNKSYQFGAENYQNGNSHNIDEQKKQKRNRSTAKTPPAADLWKFPKPVRLPEPFEPDDAALNWIAENLPGLNVANAIADFVEYWTNCPDNKKSYAKDWRLRFQKGMRLALGWQKRDAGDTSPADPGCTKCDGLGWSVVNDRSGVPCEHCRAADNAAYWKRRQ